MACAIGEQRLVAQFADPTEAGFPGLPSVAMDAAGDAVIAWRGFRPRIGNLPPQPVVLAQRYASDGTAQGVPMTVAAAPDQIPPRIDVAMDDDGDFAVVWQQRAGFSVGGYLPPRGCGILAPLCGSLYANAGTSSFHVRRYDANGASAGLRAVVNLAVETASVNRNDAEISTPSVAMSASGQMVAVWSVARNTTPSVRILAQRISALDIPLGPPIEVGTTRVSINTGRLPEVRAAASPSGAFVMAWEDSESIVPGMPRPSPQILMQPFSAAGRPLRPVISLGSLFLTTPRLAADAQGQYSLVSVGSGGFVGNQSVATLLGQSFESP